jgi:hypothetical protein
MTRPRRLGLYMPWTLFALICVGWTAYWFVARDTALRALDASIARTQALGFEAGYANVRSSGYPLRLTLTLDRLRLADAPVGSYVGANDLAISVNLSNPRHLILGSKDIAWSIEGMNHMMSAKGAQASLRFLPDGSLARASLDVSDAHVEHHGEWVSLPPTTIGKLLVHIRPDPRNAADSQLVIEAENWRGPTPVAALNALAPYQHFRAAVVVTDSATLASRTPLASWKGRLRIERFDVASARGAFAGEGDLALDAARRPEGALRAGPLTLRAADGWWTLDGQRVAEARPVLP